MQHKWSRYLRLILAILASTTLVGLYFGEPVYGLLVGLVGYLWPREARALVRRGGSARHGAEARYDPLKRASAVRERGARRRRGGRAWRA